MRVPQYTSKVAPTQSLGMPREDPNMRSGLDSAVNTLIDTADQEITDYEDRKASILLTSEKSRLRTSFMEQYQNDKINRQGQAGIPDDEAGTKGIYGDFIDASSEDMEKVLAKFSDRHKAKVFESMTGLIDGYKTQFSGLESEANLQFRSDSATTMEAATQIELTELGRQAGTEDQFNTTVKTFEDEYKELFGGRGDSIQGVVEAKKTALQQTYIQSVATRDPEQAAELLDKYGSKFTVDEKAKLKEEIEDSRIKIGADGIMATLETGNVGYQDALDVVKGIKDQAIRDEVATRVEVRNNLNKRIKFEQNKKEYENYWDKVKGLGGTPPTVGEINTNKTLSEPQREHLVNLMSGKADPAGKRIEQVFAAEEMLFRINKREMDIDDLRTAYSNRAISEKDYSSLKKTYDNIDSFPSFGKTLQVAMDLVADSVDDKEQRAYFYIRIADEANAYIEETGKAMDDHQIIELADALVVNARERKLTKPSTWLGKPAYRDPEAVPIGAPASSAAITALRQQYPQGIYDPASGGLAIGKDKYGKVVVGTDGRRILPEFWGNNR